MRSYQVKIYDIKKLQDGRARPWRVRWVVAGQEFVEAFRAKTPADNFRTDLVKASNAGQPFDTEAGLPVSDLRVRTTTTCYQLACTYLKAKWPRLAAKSRRSTVESLVAVIAELVQQSRTRSPDPTVLREALFHSAFNPHRRPSDRPAEHVTALAWLEKGSLPVVELESLDLARRVLERLALRLDGRPAAATTCRRKRAVFYNWLGYVVESGLLDSNPLDRVQWTTSQVAEAIDRRVVANPTQVKQLLDALSALGGHANHLVAFFGCIYYAGTRPSEAADLRLPDCRLPGRCLNCGTTFDDLLTVVPGPDCPHDEIEPAWGRIILAETNPYVGSQWTDDGSPRQRRGLKHRPRTHTRPVPIPPPLVALLCQHVRRHGIAPDGRLFRSPHDRPLSESCYGRWWRLVRQQVLTPQQAASPLARRPYDLRHAAASLWLNAGVPATEVARRLGHGVAVLLRVYANCIDGGEDGDNQRIGAALS